jgi:Flp pilus assembly protein TadG
MMSRFRPNRPDPRTDSGAAAVEFAIVVPVLLLLVFGIITFGIIFSQQLTLNNAAREGARKAIVNEVVATPATDNRTCDGIRRSVQDAIAGLGMTASDVSVRVTQDGWTNSNACGSGFVTSFSGAAATRTPCRGSFDVATGSRDLIVEARYESTLPAAFPPLPRTITLTSKAVYRCEFSF